MMDAFERQDWYMIGVGLLLSVAAAVHGYLGYATVQQELMINYATVVPMVPALAFIWLARGRWGGHVERYLELIGIGIAMHLVLWIPHLRWHLLAEQTGSAPAWLGLAPSFWYAAFHGFSLLAFAMMSYGFYLFWQEGVQ